MRGHAEAIPVCLIKYGEGNGGRGGSVFFYPGLAQRKL